MKRLISILVIMMFLTVAVSVKAQIDSSPVELENLLQRADAATKRYSEIFKNLSAEETKTYDDFGKDGKLKETRRIKSTFIVYQLSKGEKVSEFRNVTEFNGKTVARSDEEIEKLFAKLAGADSAAEEIKRIVKEAVRFDGANFAWGITLWQDSPFGKYRPFFEFKVVGLEQFENRKIFVVEYNQTKPTLLLKANPTDEEIKKEAEGREYNSVVAGAFRPTNMRLVGKIWLDAETGQIWRNEAKVVLHPAQLSLPVTSVELVYEFQPSQFGVLVPKRFAFTHYRITGSSDKNLSVTKFRRMLFEYSKFTEFKTEAKDYKIGNKNCFTENC